MKSERDFPTFLRIIELNINDDYCLKAVRGRDSPVLESGNRGCGLSHGQQSPVAEYHGAERILSETSVERGMRERGEDQQ